MAGKFVCSRAVACVVVAMVGYLNFWGAEVSRAQRIASTTPERVWEVQRVTVSVVNVPLGTVLQAIARQAGLVPAFNDGILPSNRRVTLHVRSILVDDAFEQVLRGTGLVARIGDARDVVIVRGIQPTSGIVVGVVSNARTKQPLQGARVSVDGIDRVETDASGTYRVPVVSSGTHTVTVKMLGFRKVTREILVNGNGSVTLDIALELSTTPLDQVIVTGTVSPTEVKAVPNAITIISAKELEQRGITRIDQLFRGDVPGLFARNAGGSSLDPGQVSMASRGSTKLDALLSSGSTNALTQPIKTYVDGVELADPSYLALIDPKSIERIEILTGPQASTIYGSNAINGVMQVFTRRGTSARPQLVATLQSGLIQNNFSSAMAPQHDYSMRVSGAENRLSYYAGGSWVYMGPWTPSVHTSTVSGSGGVNYKYGPVTVDATLLRTIATNWQDGATQQQQNVDRSTGVLAPMTTHSGPTTFSNRAQTFGMTLTYLPVAWWSHKLTVGTDAIDRQQGVTIPGYASRADTLQNFNQNLNNRSSLSYNTTANVSLGSFSSANITLGADGWQMLSTSLGSQSTALTGALSSVSLSRQASHNRGMFAQGQIGFYDQLFITYGLRAEWNPNYGATVNPNVVPRYGLAYTGELGAVTAKLRASYGHATRPPSSGQTQGIRLSDDSYYAQFIPLFGNVEGLQLPNPDLLPEQQRGTEGGVELYFGTRASLVVTRYNQTVDNLITSVIADSARSFLPYSEYPEVYGSDVYPQWIDGHGYFAENQYLNLGSIRNQGWELQGTFNAGPITTKGTYSWNKSRVIGITPKFRALFPQYSAGAPFALVPEHTWAVAVTYTHGKTSIAYNVQGQGLLYTGYTNGTQFFGSNDALYNSVYGGMRLPSESPRRSLQTNYVSRRPGYSRGDVNVSQQISRNIDGLLQIQNLANGYESDVGALVATMGRQGKAGIRIRF